MTRGELFMPQDIPFPSAAEKLARDAAEFAGASAEMRFQSLLELSALCERLLAASPCRERQLELLDEREREGRERLRRWIRSHEPGLSRSGAAR
jgi:hypothetical protein